MSHLNDLFASVLGVLVSRCDLSVEDELACRASCQSAREALIPAESNSRRLLNMLIKEQPPCPVYGAYVGTLLYLAVPTSGGGSWGVQGAPSVAPVPQGRMTIHRFGADPPGLLKWEAVRNVTESDGAEACQPLPPPPRLFMPDDSRRWCVTLAAQNCDPLTDCLPPSSRLHSLLMAGWRVAGWAKAYQARHYVRPFGSQQPWLTWPADHHDYLTRRDGCACELCTPSSQ